MGGFVLLTDFGQCWRDVWLYCIQSTSELRNLDNLTPYHMKLRLLKRRDKNIGSPQCRLGAAEGENVHLTAEL